MPERSSKRKPRILVVDDQRALAETLADGLADRGYDALALDNGAAALTELAKGGVDLLVTDLRMPDLNGMQLLDEAKKLPPERRVPMIVMTAYAAIDSAVEAIRHGAFHYLTKPFKLEELVVFIERALEDSELRREAHGLRTTLREQLASKKVLGKSAPFLAALEVLERVRDADVPVLLLGETGTGKSLLARALHANSSRASGPFVAVNCAAIPETLLESELFGHLKGAFTGATSDRAGLFAEADGGIIFLDEIAELSAPVQAKLLHVIEGKSLRPVGASRDRPLDVRIVAATHRDLRARVVQNLFREDLLYRLDVVRVQVPPLRERAGDLPLLTEQFLLAARADAPQSPVRALSPAVVQRFQNYRWPGNVRELQHVLARLVLLGRDEEVQESALPPELLGEASSQQIPAQQASLQQAPQQQTSAQHAPLTAKSSSDHFQTELIPVRELQRHYAAWATEKLGGQRGKAASVLGVDGKTLARWLSDESKDEPQS